jgi:ornithine cyclodeaminase
LNILDLSTIKDNLDVEAVLTDCENHFDMYSAGLSVVPPVGHLPFESGDCHIKYGYMKGDDYFVIKVVSGFHQNVKIGLKPSIGLMLVCSAKTGYPVALLNDEGHLTDVRTAAAGAIAAKYLAPSNLAAIGIVGAGIQAKLQLQLLRSTTDCRKVHLWNRSKANAEKLIEEFKDSDFEICHTESLEQLVRACRLIITTTPSTEALIFSNWVQPGTHITAVGADCPGKQEIDEALVERADVLVVDSVSQCIDQGEVQHAVRNKRIRTSDLIELGNVISGRSDGRQSDDQITIADLTGVAVQDIAIAKSVYQQWLRLNENS